MISALGPSWGSSESAPKTCRTTATSPYHFFEDVSGEIDIFEDPKVSPAISTFQVSEDVSGETLIFKIRGLKAASATSHFFEDVSGGSPIFEDPKIRQAISTSPFCEDVSSETLIFSIRRLKRKPPTSRFGGDVSSETLTFQTFPDMNGKRVKAKSCARTCSMIRVKCKVGELSERPQGIYGGNDQIARNSTPDR